MDVVDLGQPYGGGALAGELGERMSAEQCREAFCLGGRRACNRGHHGVEYVPALQRLLDF